MVTDVAAPAVLTDETGNLGPGEARCLLEETLDLPLARLPQAWVEHPLQRSGDEGVGPGDFRQLDAFHEGPHLLDATGLVGREIHDHAPMIAAPRPSGSSPLGNPPPLQAHPSLDKTETGVSSAGRLYCRAAA